MKFHKGENVCFVSNRAITGRIVMSCTSLARYGSLYPNERCWIVNINSRDESYRDHVTEDRLDFIYEDGNASEEL